MIKIFLCLTIAISFFACNDHSSKNDAKKNEGMGEMDPNTSGNDLYNTIYPKTNLQRELFSLAYPSDWAIDSSHKDRYNNDLMLVAPEGSGFLRLQAFKKEQNTNNIVDGRVKHWSKSFKSIRVEYFKSWASYNGYGAIMHGEMTNEYGEYESEVKVFSYTSKNSSFLMETSYDIIDSGKAMKGIRMIESSFKLQ